MTVLRLKWPLEVGPDGRLLTVEQDSDADMAQCLLAIARTRPAERPDLPDMYLPDLTFGEEPLDVDELVDVLEQHEPRTPIFADQSPDAFERAVVDVTLAYRPPTQDPDGG